MYRKVKKDTNAAKTIEPVNNATSWRTTAAPELLGKSRAYPGKVTPKMERVTWTSTLSSTIHVRNPSRNKPTE